MFDFLQRTQGRTCILSHCLICGVPLGISFDAVVYDSLAKFHNLSQGLLLSVRWNSVRAAAAYRFDRPSRLEKHWVWFWPW